MGSIQSLLAIGAIALFALVSVRFNSSVLQNLTVEVENKVYLTAFSLADDLIEEIKQKAFDEETVEWRAITTAELTPKANFGVYDSGESTVADFDDIDDFDGYSKPVSLPHAEGYLVTCAVDYVDINNPDNISGSQTFAKRIHVTVSSKYLSHPVQLSFIFTLHSK
jgi:hypothetical protein